jgi:urease accessory protein
VASQASRAPLRCVRAFPLASGERVLQLLHVGPGVMAGDRLELDVDVGPGAQAVVVAQAATKLHAMDGDGHATFDVRLRVAEGGSLEVHPGLTIPFARSAFRQTVHVDLAPGARFAWVERWAAGRLARGERHAYRHASSRLRVRVDGVPAYADALVLEPARAAGVGVFEGRGYVASALFVDGQEDEAAAALVDLAPPPGVAAAAYTVGPGRVALRASADDGVALRAFLTEVVDRWRAAGGRPALALDRYGS